MVEKHIELITQELGVSRSSVINTLQLLSEGATIPFIARYRKERTGMLDEVQIGSIQRLNKKYTELEDRKIFIIESITEQGKLTPELKAKIENSYNPEEIEDLYLPYKKRKKTRADVARDNGLEPLAKAIMSQRGQDIEFLASKYISDTVATIQAAINGAKDIIAEWVNEDQSIRERLRETVRKTAQIKSVLVPKKKEEAAKFQDYFEFAESLSRCPSHRFLAMMRGESESMLRISLVIDDERAIESISRRYIKSNSDEEDIIYEAIQDAYKRLLYPSIEGQVLADHKEKADEEAILVFGKNLRQLLLAAPLGQKKVMAIDPGFRTGCKVVCLDANGQFLSYDTIFPHPPQSYASDAKETIRNLVYKYQISVIGIGNGTASRETKMIIDQIKFDAPVEVYIVNESGASIYSASEVAREEFPDKDVTVRGAISIGRRLMDPLAELVKIDPKSIGVGQYQHDVHQGKLKENLEEIVISCVNNVGVNINTSSRHLLTYIAGLGPTIAQNIVDYRTINGDFDDIKQLTKVPRLGQKAFEQAAGFLRIRNGKNPLDNTGVHPDAYPIVTKMAKDNGMDIESFIKAKDVRDKMDLKPYFTETVGLPTLKDIMKELDKPGLDPRGEAKSFAFDDNIKSVDDVSAGMVVPGIVTNMTNFGAFIDIGVKQDGLVHISQISRKFITNPAEVLSLGQEVTVKVLDVDHARKRINLSMFV